MSQHLTTCTFCGVGCGIYLESSGNRIIGTHPSVSHPANRGRICLRGWHVYEIASSPDRLTRPLLKKNKSFEEVSWDEAYDTIVERLKDIRKKHGPDSIGFLNSALCANEDTYLLQKFARAVIGTNNVDQGTSPYRTNSIEVLREMTGVPAASNSIADIAKASTIIVSEIDVGQQLPTIGGWIIRAKLAGAQLIVCGSRRHRIAEHADIFLQIKPGTETFLYAAMAKIIIDRGLIDRSFVNSRCNDYDEFAQNMQYFDVFDAAERCGVSHELIEMAAVAFAKSGPAMLLYSTGSEATGKDLIRSMVNLILLTGNIGKPGCGIMPLSEHNNVQGGCDMGMLPHYLPGYKPISDPVNRRFFERRWNCQLPDTPGMDTLDILGLHGRLKALWLDRHNPVVSATYCDADVAIKKMDFVILQNLFMSRTAEQADVILPTPAFGEETISFTSTERRVQLAVQAIEPPEHLIPAWKQICEIAKRFGVEWSYISADDVMKEIGTVVPEYQAAHYKNLRSGYGRQWPCTTDRPLGTEILFADQDTTHQFNFALIEHSVLMEKEPADFPFVLAVGHSLYYWHKNTLIQHSETLKREYGILLLDYPNGFVEINPQDAQLLNIKDGNKIRIAGSRGSVESVARITNEVRRGIVYVPYFEKNISRQLYGESGDIDNIGRRVVYVRIEKAG